MTSKKRRDFRRSTTAPDPEKWVRYVSTILTEPRIEESSEISPDAALGMRCDYAEFCGNASLIPVPHGWGLLHCTVRDKRGRRARVTLATEDLTYHRVYIQAALYTDRRADLDLALARYPYLRSGWPGPARQGGSWTFGEPIPWRPTYRQACPDMPHFKGLPGVRVAASGEVRVAYAVFAKSAASARWTMLDDEPIQTHSKIILPSCGAEFHVPAGTGVLPGWPLMSTPNSMPALK